MRPYQVRRSKSLLLLLLAGLTFQFSFGQEKQHALSARQAVDYALKNSAQVKNALTSIKIQLQTNRDVTSAALPSLNGFVSGTNYMDIPTQLIPGEFFNQPGTYIPVQFGTRYNVLYGAELKQLLFDGQVFVGLQARDAAMEFASLNAAVTEEVIKANVYKIYYQLAVGKKQLEVFDINITRTETLLHNTQEMYKNGFQEKLDVDKLLVNLSNLRTDKLKIENRLKTGNVALKYLLGMPVKEVLILTDTVSEASIKEDLLSGDSAHYENRKEYQLLKTTEKLGQYNIRRYQMGYLPTVSLTGSYSQNAQRNKFNFFKSGQPWFKSTYIGLRIDVPIFDGFSKDAKIKKARMELDQTRTTMVDMVNRIQTEIDTAQISLHNALVTMTEQKKNMELAEQVYNQAKLKYERGLGSNLEVTNAEAELKTAQNNYFSSLYDAVVAKIEYLRATGKL
jgi:outer membrane protein TolC